MKSKANLFLYSKYFSSFLTTRNGRLPKRCVNNLTTLVEPGNSPEEEIPLPYNSWQEQVSQITEVIIPDVTQIMKGQISSITQEYFFYISWNSSIVSYL